MRGLGKALWLAAVCPWVIGAWAAAPSASSSVAHALPGPALRVALDDSRPPYASRDAEDRLQGYLVERWALWSRRSGRPVDLQGLTWTQARQRVLDGQADVLDGVAVGDPPELHLEVAAPYSEAAVLLYHRAHLAGLSDAASARSFVVGVKEGGDCADHLEAAGATHLLRYPGNDALVRAALLQEVEVFCMSQPSAELLLTQMGIQDAFRRSPALYTQRISWAVRRGRSDLAHEVAAGFARLDPQAEVALQRRWFGEALPGPRSPYLQWAGYGVLGLSGLLLVMLLWLRSLRAAVQRQTAALREQQARLGTLFRTLPDPIWLKDAEGRVQACNLAYERLLGRPEAEIVGRRDVELVGAAQAASFQASDARALASPQPVTELQQVALAGGAQRLYEVTKTRVEEASGRLFGVLGVARDITEAQQLQTELAERVKEQRCLYAVFRASEDLTRPLDMLLDEVVALLPPAWLHPEVAVARIEWDGKFHDAGPFDAAVVELSAPIQRGDGVCGRVAVGYRELRPTQDEGPFLEEERKLVNAVAERLAGIWQRRQAEARLHDSEERFRVLFEHTRQAITLIADNRFIAANRASLDMLRMQRLEDLLGRSPADLSPPCQPDGRDSRKAAEAYARQALREGVVEFEWQHLRADGDPSSPGSSSPRSARVGRNCCT